MSKKVTNIPDFLIVGAAKAGTSSLHSYLSMHPDIYMPEKRKELYFWHVATNINRSIIDHAGERNIPTQLDEYLKYFKNARQEQIKGEACPSYFYFHDHVLENLKKHHTNWQDVKIVIILREPVSRIISQYRFVCKKGLDPDFLNFSDSLEAEPFRVKENNLLPDLFYTNVSMYAEKVQFFLNNFKNVYVCLYDDLKETPGDLLNNLCEFLGVASGNLPELEFETVNSSFGARKLKYPLLSKIARNVGRPVLSWLPKKLKKYLKTKFENSISEPIMIPNKDIVKLKEDFVPEIKKLEAILNKDLSNWYETKN